MLGACKLNNKIMRNIRRESVYQCLVIDLGMLGILSKEQCQLLIGSGIPKGLVLPNNENAMDAADIEDIDSDIEDTVEETAEDD